MTSEERREVRYRRRRARRAKAKALQCPTADCYDYIFHYHALYRAYQLSRRGVSWKGSVQRYIHAAPVNVYNTWVQLREERYQPPRFNHFTLYERGKKRHIRSTNIADRVVQRALCDGALVPMLGRTFIYDNGACMKNKGYTFAVRRMVCHLSRHIRKHGTGGYVLVGDIKSYFNSVPHRLCMELLEKQFDDPRILALTKKMIAKFDEGSPAGEGCGLGLGSQISQVLAPAAMNSVDHYIKEVLRISGYARYNDDFYLIHEDREFLEAVADAIDEKLAALGLTMNRKKTQIRKITKGFTFLKVRVRVTESGKIVRKMSRSSIVRERRKLKKLARKARAGAITLRQLYESFQSWMSYAKHFASFRTRCWMEALYYRLTGGLKDEMV